MGNANAEVLVCLLRRDIGLKSLDDFMKAQIIIGATAPGSTTADFPMISKGLLGAQFRLVTGYQGSREVTLAIEKNEVQGICGLPLSTLKAEWKDHWEKDEFIPLLNKAGGAGFQVTAYTQTWSDVEARIGSPAKAGQIAGNFNTLIMLRVKEMATAELLTDQLPEVHVVSTIVSSSVSDTNDPGEFTDFASRNEDRIAKFVHADVQAFEKSKNENKIEHRTKMNAHLESLVKQIDENKSVPKGAPRTAKIGMSLAEQELLINKKLIEDVENGAQMPGQPGTIKRPF
jgi:hypothetical protein